MVMLMLLDVVSALLRLCSGMSLQPYVSHKGVKTNAAHSNLLWILQMTSRRAFIHRLPVFRLLMIFFLFTLEILKIHILLQLDKLNVFFSCNNFSVAITL